MIRRIRRIVAFFLAVIIFMLFSPVAFADELSEYTYELEESAGNNLPQDVKDELSDMDISLTNPESLANLSVEKLWELVKDSFVQGILNPLSLLGKLIGIMLICSIASSLSDDKSHSDKILETVAALATIGVTYEYLSEALAAVVEMLTSLGGFMVSYVPVFVSVVTASSAALSASGYYVALLALCEVVAIAANKILPAISSVIIATSIAESVSPLNDCTFATAVKKVTNRVIAFLSTIFVGVLSINSIVGASADSVAVRSAKFAASSFVPVIGSAVAEAYTTVRGSLSLVRSATGAFGIIAVVFIALRPIMSAAGLSLVVYIAKEIAELFSLKAPKAFLKGMNELMSVLLTASILLSLMFVISTAVLMLSCMNV